MQLTTRLRRNRSSEGLRRMIRETRLEVADLAYPLFVHAGDGNEPVSSIRRGKMRTARLRFLPTICFFVPCTR
jgi:delta-aminolevulinic acid dehydratase/porphobilinogen synthase